MAHTWHQGEIAIHKQLNVTNVNRGRELMTTRSMPAQHQAFFSSLSYFICATQEDGQPWASILCGPPGFLRAVSPNHLAFSTVADLDIQQGSQIAGLGIDLATRRRNKVFGHVHMLRRTGTTLQAIILTSESLGNCPKYINTRKLVYHERTPCEEALSDAACADFIARADTLFLATCGPDDMDVNHRGGPPGFVCTSLPLTLYIPDYSGNQLFSSLGNIESTGIAGVTIPDFSTGDMLYLTGEACNLFGDAAAAHMPVGRLTRLIVTKKRFVRQGLNLQLQDTVGFSPYNPLPFRLGRQETVCQATLMEKTALTPTITRYRWQLDKPVSCRPGQYGIFDFYKELSLGYTHMNDADPQSLNDSYIRTWTLTSATRVECMLRTAGAVTRFLKHHHGPLTVPFRGVGGDFGANAGKILFVAGGIGLTPAIALSTAVDMEVVYACKEEDEALLDQVQVKNKRAVRHLSDLTADLVTDREIYCCGPPGFCEGVAAIAQKEIHLESFSY